MKFICFFVFTSAFWLKELAEVSDFSYKGGSNELEEETIRDGAIEMIETLLLSNFPP